MIIIVQLFYCNIATKEATKRFDHYIGQISEARRERIKQFRFFEDKLRSLYGEVMVRTLAVQQYHLENKDLSFEWNEYGKPRFCDPKLFQFSISHSGDYVICGIADHEVGVDIEKERQISIHGIIKHFFTSEEYETYLSLAEGERINWFYDCWTLKESYVKCLGKGLSIPLNGFGVSKNGNHYEIENEEAYCFKTLSLMPEYHVAACVKDEIIGNCITELEVI